MRELKIRNTSSGTEGWVGEHNWKGIKEAMAGVGRQALYQFTMRVGYDFQTNENIFWRSIAGPVGYGEQYVVVEEGLK